MVLISWGLGDSRTNLELLIDSSQEGEADSLVGRANLCLQLTDNANTHAEERKLFRFFLFFLLSF